MNLTTKVCGERRKKQHLSYMTHFLSSTNNFFHYRSISSIAVQKFVNRDRQLTNWSGNEQDIVISQWLYPLYPLNLHVLIKKLKIYFNCFWNIYIFVFMYKIWLFDYIKGIREWNHFRIHNTLIKKKLIDVVFIPQTSGFNYLWFNLEIL